MANQAATAHGLKSRAKPTYPPFPKEDEALVRLPQVLTVLPIGRTSWLDGVRDGRFPKPCKMGKATLWKAGDIRRVLAEIGEGKHE